jgi:TetR/AcrR family transcriptional regulator, transcriptional repressor for nem operon
VVSRTKPKEQRRADLLGAAKGLFVTKGIAATTLEDITDGAGVSKGLFYVYFRSKAEVVRALQEDFSRRFAERLVVAAGTEDDWGRKLDACVQASFDSYREWRDLHEVLFHRDEHCHDGGPETEPTHVLLVNALRNLLDDGIKAGAFEVEDPETTATLLYVAMHAFDPTMYGGRPPGDQKVIRATKELFRRTAGVR